MKAVSLKQKIVDMINGLHLGHQMGQWSERRAWGQCLPGCDRAESEITTDQLTSSDSMEALIISPPPITTPGWGPTGYVDTVPHISALGNEYSKLHRALAPEDFRAFLLRERTWLRLQGVGRTSVELMDEGMNPRITGLFAGSVVSGCWVAWPAAVYQAGEFDDAYEDAVKLCRAQSGGDIVELTGALAAAVSAALIPGSAWEDVRAALCEKLRLRNKPAYENLEYALLCARASESTDELIERFRSEDAMKRFSVYAYNLDNTQSLYAALGALEFQSVHPMDWLEWMRLNLLLSDSRFGAMIGSSLYAALHGMDGFPGIWKASLEQSRDERTAAWIKNAYPAVESRVRRAKESAVKALDMTDGGDKGVRGSRLYDRILAANMIGAAANAMGSPVEDRDYPWIAEKYGVVEKILDVSRFEAEDDAAMGILWAETIIERGGRIYPEDLADTFRARLDPRCFYYDTQVSYKVMEDGLAPHACGHWNVVTGSALMGCNPVGEYHAGRPDLAAVDGLELSYLYQRGFDVHAAAMLCAATAEALADGSTVDSIIESALKAAPMEPLACFNRTERRYAREYFERVLRAVEGHNNVLEARETLYNYLEYNGQDPWEVIAFTLAIFKISGGDPWKAAVGGTNIGRDSDTIACQSALLSACMTGMAGMPAYFASIFTDEFKKTHERIAEGLTGLVRKKALDTIAMADELCIMG